MLRAVSLSGVDDRADRSLQHLADLTRGHATSQLPLIVRQAGGLRLSSAGDRLLTVLLNNALGVELLESGERPRAVAGGRGRAVLHRRVGMATMHPSHFLLTAIDRARSSLVRTSSAPAASAES